MRSLSDNKMDGCDDECTCEHKMKEACNDGECSC